VRRWGDVPVLVHHAERTHGVVVEIALEVGEDDPCIERIGGDAVDAQRGAPTANRMSALPDCP
jgi:hypothetical protein